MSKPNKRTRKKRIALERAMPTQYAPGGALMYVPPGYAQSTLGQTYYGTSMKNLPVGQSALFSPGIPLPTQPNVNIGGLPTQWRFPVSFNTFPVDRTLGYEEIPTFEQLHRLSIMDYGLALCERYWLDMVPRMTLKVGLTPEAVAGGAEEKNYQKEITYFKNFFGRPDGQDLHTWIRTALINQSRYDELYIYKNRTRGGKLLGLAIIDGSQMKPLLDDWGRIPEAPKYAYQQYPWGIPGMQYSTEQMLHYRETPASDTPFGFSRVERVIVTTNLALRKQKMDLSHFTEGNIPAGILQPPESSQWTPDQLDAYEQSWNALLAGNLQQLSRIKVTQPGFTYTPFVQPSFDSVFDRFLLNIRCSSYGITMGDLGFTETVNKSSSDSQENVTYRRTIGPLASIYAAILTEIMHTDFSDDLHGDMFQITFGGYDESEDLQALATAYSTLTNAGILGLSNAGKLMKLPEDPDAPHIGRVFMSKDGPVFLDDMASDKLRNAAVQAKMAGLQMATQNPGAKPGQQSEEDESDGQDSQDDTPTEKKQSASSDTATNTNSNQDQKKSTKAGNTHAGNAVDKQSPGNQKDHQTAERSYSMVPEETEKADFRRWREIAIKDIKAGKQVRTFVSDVIPEEIHIQLSLALERCTSADEVRAVFKAAQENDTDFFGVALRGRNPNGDHPTNNNLLWRNASLIASERS